MSMPIADDKVGTLGRSPEDPTPPADICRSGFGEDFDTLLPWHVNSGWVLTSTSGEEWLLCSLVAQGESTRPPQYPHQLEISGRPRLAFAGNEVCRLVLDFPDHVRHRSPKASPPRRCANPGQQGPETPPIQSEWHRVAGGGGGGGGVLSMPQPQSHSPLLWTLPHNVNRPRHRRLSSLYAIAHENSPSRSGDAYFGRQIEQGQGR